MPTPKEIEDAIALRQKLKEHGLFRAIELMGPTERSYARRTICHALEAFASPKAAGIEATVEEIAQQLYEAQRSRLTDQGGISAQREWNSKSAPDIFWEEYRNDARALLAKNIIVRKPCS